MCHNKVTVLQRAQLIQPEAQSAQPATGASHQTLRLPRAPDLSQERDIMRCTDHKRPCPACQGCILRHICELKLHNCRRLIRPDMLHVSDQIGRVCLPYPRWKQTRGSLLRRFEGMRMFATRRELAPDNSGG